MLSYYAQVSPYLLPLLADRPVTRVRYPHGTGDMSFFEKNLPSGAPSWVRHTEFDEMTYPFVPDIATLTYLVNLNSLEFHVPQWRVGRDGAPAHPDRLVLDLDPGKPAGLRECARVALLLRERLSALGLELVPVTSGSKGMQLYASLGGDLSSDQVRDLAQQLAQEMTKKHPDLVLWKMTKSLRPGKIFLDWSQNVGAKTTIAPYSLRGRELPTVAAPRTWDEVEAGADGAVFEQVLFEDLLERVAELGDLTAGLHEDGRAADRPRTRHTPGGRR